MARGQQQTIPYHRGLDIRLWVPCFSHSQYPLFFIHTTITTKNLYGGNSCIHHVPTIQSIQARMVTSIHQALFAQGLLLAFLFGFSLVVRWRNWVGRLGVLTGGEICRRYLFSFSSAFHFLWCHDDDGERFGVCSAAVLKLYGGT